MILDLDIEDLKVIDIVLGHEIDQFPVESPVRDMLQSIQNNIRKVMNNG